MCDQNMFDFQSWPFTIQSGQVVTDCDSKIEQHYHHLSFGSDTIV